MKSLCVSVFWPAWVWTTQPQARWLFGSHSMKLATRHSRHNREVISSTWYRKAWGDVFSLAGDQNQKQYFENNKLGYRLCCSVSASAIGQGGDYIIADDPHDPEEAQSDVQRQAVLDWWDGTMMSSVNDPDTVSQVLIMQRVHHQDLAGHLIEQGGWELLCLPSEFVPEKKCSTSIFTDPRTQRGELLFPNRFRKEYIEDQKHILGARFNGQHQQNPSPQEGGLVKRHWWGFWKPYGLDLPPVEFQLKDGSFHKCRLIDLPSVPVEGNGHRRRALDIELQSWDMAFKETQESSFVVGQAWGAKDANRFLLDQTRRKMNFADTLKEVRAMSESFPDTSEKLVEDKANGPAVISALRDEISGLIPVEPQGGKEARAQAVLPQIESGNVFLPHPAIAPWVMAFIDEWASAPNGDYWDQIDAGSQALTRMQRKPKLVLFT